MLRLLALTLLLACGMFQAEYALAALAGCPDECPDEAEGEQCPPSCPVCLSAPRLITASAPVLAAPPSRPLAPAVWPATGRDGRVFTPEIFHPPRFP